MHTRAGPALRPLLWAVAAFLGGVLLHADRLPVWASVAALACAAWRLAAAFYPVRLPGRHTRIVLAIALTGAVFIMFRTLNGLAAGTALLVVMGSVKLLESAGRRDLYVTVAAALFLLLAACLDRQGLLRAPLYLLQAWLSCTALAVAAHPQRPLSNRDASRLAARSLLLAAPLAVVLFLFFPRLPGSFWALPRSDQALTGLSDSMSPGSITQLSESSDPAFRVWFDGAPPPPEERYWRGPVLHEFDGYTWTRVRGRFYRQEGREYLGQPYHYRITLEPHSGPWWFALDTVTGSPRPGVLLTYDYQLVGVAGLTEPVTFEATSHTRTRALGPLSTLARRYDTALPHGRNPRTGELARRMRARAGTQAQFVHSVLELFRTGGFEYTLTPPRLDFDSVDDFLFNTRRGFCGHYASAFVALMRAADIPARIVTGYLGGEWNPIGQYFVVRQSDAHAWAEIWVENQGWMRIDPTGVVAPERLQRGILDLLLEASSAPARLIRRTPWLARVPQMWDAMNAWWSSRVVEFDLKAQLALLERLGFDAPGWRQLGWAVTLGLGGWLAWMAWQLGRLPRAAPPDRIAKAYERLCARLARSGIARKPHAGPLAYAEAIRAQRPDLAAAVRPLLERYAELRFGTAAQEPGAIGAFERAVSRLRIRGRRV